MSFTQQLNRDTGNVAKLPHVRLIEEELRGQVYACSYVKLWCTLWHNCNLVTRHYNVGEILAWDMRSAKAYVVNLIITISVLSMSVHQCKYLYTHMSPIE